MEKRKLAEAFPPCDFIKEEMEYRGWDVERLAKEADIDPLRMFEVVEGTRQVHPYIADGLAQAFGTSREVWVNLQDAWDTHRTGIDPDDWRDAIKSLFFLMHSNDIKQCILNRTDTKVSIVLKNEADFDQAVREFAEEMEESLADCPEMERLPNGKWRFRDALDATELTDTEKTDQ